MHSRRAVVLGIATSLCAGCGAPATLPSPQFLTANAPPVIQALYRNTERAEIGGEIELTAVVADGEARPSDIRYEWSATAGAFTGKGATVRWHAPAVAVPPFHQLRLDVIERYTLIGAGRLLPSESRTSAGLTVHVNDSKTEVTKLAFTFINDFVHPERSPEYCVRNFSDNCGGKADELSDVHRNRVQFIVNPVASTFAFRSMTFNTPANSPEQATGATVRLNCRFVSIRKETGLTEVAEGICRMTNVYENFQWRLCESLFDPPSGSSATAFIF